MSPKEESQQQLEVRTGKYADRVFALTKDEYEALKDSIKQNGLYHPIIINEKGNVLDGHHRLKACEELGIQPRFEVKEFEDETQEELFVIDTNIARRQLSDYQKGELLLSKKKPFWRR